MQECVLARTLVVQCGHATVDVKSVLSERNELTHSLDDFVEEALWEDWVKARSLATHLDEDMHPAFGVLTARAEQNEISIITLLD